MDALGKRFGEDWAGLGALALGLAFCVVGHYKCHRLDSRMRVMLQCSNAPEGMYPF